MTTYNHVSTVKSKHHWLSTLKKAVLRSLKGLTIEQMLVNEQYRQDYRQVAKLPDHLLKDVGISRAEINLKLNKPFWWS